MSFFEKQCCNGQPICENIDCEDLFLQTSPTNSIEEAIVDGYNSTKSEENKRQNENQGNIINCKKITHTNILKSFLKCYLLILHNYSIVLISTYIILVYLQVLMGSIHNYNIIVWTFSTHFVGNSIRPKCRQTIDNL